MSSNPFDDYRSEVDSFPSSLQSLMEDIREEAEGFNEHMVSLSQWELQGNEWVCVSGPASEYRQGPWERPLDGHVAAASYRPSFVDEVARVMQEFVPFADGDPKILRDEIIPDLEAASSDLEQAADNMNWVTTQTTLEKWWGGAADDFRHGVVHPFKWIVSRQVTLLAEVGVAAACYQEMIQRGRADVLDLGHRLKDKLGASSGIDLGTVLWLVAAVATGSTLATAAWAARIAWTAANASTALGKIEGAASEGDDSKPGIDGDVYEPSRIIESCLEQMADIDQEVAAQHRYVNTGLVEMVDDSTTTTREVGTDGTEIEIRLSPRRPDLLDATDAGDLGTPSESLGIDDVANLRVAGLAYIPMAAGLVHEAWEKVTGLDGRFESALGRHWAVPGFRSNGWSSATGALGHALKNTRDFLYGSAENLTEIAEGYYDTDELNRQVIEMSDERIDSI
jgi:hypothetical protein